MQSPNVTLPSFEELLQSLNGPNPPPLPGRCVQPGAGPTSAQLPAIYQYLLPQPRTDFKPSATSPPPPVNVQHPPPQPKTHSEPSATHPLPIITVDYRANYQTIPGPLGP
ncbi:hypothetical protein EDD18DRAFT_1110550 [Armillaria luteobubalina]|uniref:Uncharacterized protein n=1 Tax=Armillaria luteobubalina TaxID=153913 RepID=A0AA39TGV3_9AGAR|nr:hypothetical protein EDD18DRAFT_1110550 [Armillaria luteobubalina]